MLLEEFILRYVKLEAGFVSVLKMDENCISFRLNNEAKRALFNLNDLLNTLLSEQDGKFVLSLNMADKCLDFKFLEAGV